MPHQKKDSIAEAEESFKAWAEPVNEAFRAWAEPVNAAFQKWASAFDWTIQDAKGGKNNATSKVHN